MNLDKCIGGGLKSVLTAAQFNGKESELLIFPTLGKLKATQAILVGLGKRSRINADGYRKAAGDVAKKIGTMKKVVWMLDPGPKGFPTERIASVVTEGLAMGSYRFDRYKKAETSNKKQVVELVFGVVDGHDLDSIDQMIRRGQCLGEATVMARDLANLPPNDLTPDRFVKFAKETLKKTSVEIEVIDQKKAAHYGMGAFLGVAQGSKSDAYILIIRYHPQKNVAPIVLVGKGVTFDSGGISIKQSKAMSDMKADMSGAAAVLAAMNAC
ncbi:hypothetical protein EBZ35_08360 [bacterium]|nr:hypothetical protein [bacterium]